MAVDNKSHAIMGGVLVGIGYFLQGRKGFNAEKKSLARNTIKAKGRNSYDRFKHNMEMKVKMLSPHFKKKYAKENRLPSLTSGGTTRYWQAYVDGWREMENAKVKDMGDVIGLGFKPENAFSVNEYWGRIDGADAYMDWRRGKKDTSGYYSKAYFIPTEEYDVMNAESFNADHCQECGRKEGPYSDTKLVACQGCHELACQHCLKGDKSSCKFCFKGVSAETFNAEMVDVENLLIEIPCVIDGQDAILTNFGYGVHGDEIGRLHFYFSDGDFVFEDDWLESQGDTWEEKRKRLNKDMDRIFKENNIPPHKGVGVDESRIDLRRVIEEWGISELEWDEEKGDLMLTLELNDGVDKQYAYISTPLKRDDFVNHNNAETLSKSHHDPHSLEYNPTGICKTYTCRTEIGGMYEDSDAMRFKRFLEEYPKQFGIKNVRLKPQPEANIPLGAVYITFEICDDSEWSLVTDETGELYGHTEWGIKELKQRLDYDLNVAMRNDLDKYADLHRPIQTLAEGDEPNENWYMEAETFSAEAEGGMLYSKNEMPAGKRHYVWSLDSDEAGRYQVRIVGSDMTPAIPMKYFERAWEGTATNKRNPSMSFDEPKKGEYHPHILDFRYPKYMRKSNDPLKQGLKHQISIDANEWDWERFSRENPKLLRKLYNKDGQFFYIFDNFDPSNYRYQNRRNRYRGA
jgi:hypothetical protein